MPRGRPRILHEVVAGQETKRCSRCKLYLPLSSFTKCHLTWDNLNAYCKGCIKEYKNSQSLGYSLERGKEVDLSDLLKEIA